MDGFSPMSDRKKMHDALEKIAAAADTMPPAQGFGFAIGVARSTLNTICTRRQCEADAYQKAALAAFRSAPEIGLVAQATRGMSAAGLLDESATLDDALVHDAFQVGRYIGELLQLSGHGTPSAFWPEEPPRPVVQATPTEVADMAGLLAEALESGGLSGYWRQRALALLAAVKET